MKKYIKNINSILYGSLMLLSLAIACKKDKKAPVPLVTTIGVANITDAKAEIKVSITDDQGYPVTERGVCWSRSNPNPTITAPNHTAKDMDSTPGFTKTIDNLNPFDTYYVRAYATSSAGTGYGEVLTFKTLTGTVIDQANNTYHTITIGNQVWMQENLKTSLFTSADNGSQVIPYITDPNLWSVATKPALCVYDNNPANKDIYGYLYNWYAVNTGKLAPIGWKVPSDADWKILFTNLGNINVAGGKLKETGTTHWLMPNTDATNETGFMALPGGFTNGIFGNLGKFGFFWTTSSVNMEVINYQIGFDTGNVLTSSSAYSSGFSVRCLRETKAND